MNIFKLVAVFYNTVPDNYQTNIYEIKTVNFNIDILKKKS
ncbi:hypothetical protein MTBBW1_1260021 [Desulfamplus magnetovallimortis]|uniref:Uncharacterized protein n=1 Tax=Desulfamplus magnetovallimortis TaxID=1246637 RepID=A0A1W1H6L9_9BACT|nr:hypothetical protein MTBBW1_1260021 [Desulfamplus magnetovallimortis]